MSSFTSQMKQFENMTEKKAEQVFRQTCFGISNEIISKTPADTSRAKNNWFPDINKFSTETTEETNPRGSIDEVNKVTSKLKLGTTFTLSNNLDYIEKIEYGLFTTKAETEKTINGFSKKAPRGMVGVALQLFDSYVKDANKSS